MFWIFLVKLEMDHCALKNQILFFIIALADHSTGCKKVMSLRDSQVGDQKVAEHGRSHEFQAELQLFKVWQFIQLSTGKNSSKFLMSFILRWTV